MIRKEPCDRINIAQIAFDKGCIGVDGRAMALVQVVEHYDRVAGLDQLGGGNAANVAGAAGDEYFHRDLFPCCEVEERRCGR